MKRIYVYIILLLSVNLSFAEKLRLNPDVTISPEKIYIGEQATLSMMLDVPKDYFLIWPVIADTLSRQIEVVTFGRPDTLAVTDDGLRLSQQHTITAWEGGFFPVPPLSFMLISQQDTIVAVSKAMLLEVVDIEINQEEDIKDIKHILGLPLSWAELLPYVLGVLLLVLSAWALYRYFSRRKKPQLKDTVWTKPDIPAHIAAMSALESLKSKNLWQTGKVKLFHSELTDILRMYLEKRYGVRAPEMTTTEILTDIGAYLPKKQLIDELRTIMEIADLVKFAKYQPAATQHESALEMAFNFVAETKLVDKDV